MVAIAPPAFVVDEARAGPTLAMAGLDPADADLDAPGLAVEALLNELGVASCPLTGPLREAAAQTGETLYLPYDGHWSAAGHRVVADALDACLTASGAP